MNTIIDHKGNRLFIVLGGFLIANALVAEFMGVKIFSLEDTLGLQPWNINLFGEKGSLSFTAGVLLWPFVFIMTDIINEYFGVRGVRFLSYVAAALIAYAFLATYTAIQLVPPTWWIKSNEANGVPDMQAAYKGVFGQSNWIVVGSLVAFLIGQVLDAFIFHKIKAATGEGKIWLRATGSTIVSQLVDSFVVLYIAFVLGPQHWSISLFLAVGTINFCYKVLAAIVMTPLLYFVHELIERYLGKELATKMKADAAK